MVKSEIIFEGGKTRIDNFQTEKERKFKSSTNNNLQFFTFSHTDDCSREKTEREMENCDIITVECRDVKGK